MNQDKTLFTAQHRTSSEGLEIEGRNPPKHTTIEGGCNKSLEKHIRKIN